MKYIMDEGEVRIPKDVFPSLKNITPEYMQSLVMWVLARQKANLVINGGVGSVDG